MDVSQEQLEAFLDEALPEAEMARIEQALRSSESLRAALKAAIEHRDRGEHSLGAIWRRERISCPTREQVGSFLLGALDDGWQDYIAFHLDIVECPYCQANRADLEARQAEAPPHTQHRRQRFFASSAGLLRPGDTAPS
jgi:hypothetical protein